VLIVELIKKKHYELDKLQKEVLNILPTVQSDVYALYMQSYDPEIIEKKYKVLLRTEIPLIAALSAASGAIPIPGVGIACDLGILKPYGF